MCFKSALSLDPKYLDAYICLGNLLSDLTNKKRNFAEAIFWLKSGLELDRSCTEALFVLGNIYLSEDNPEFD